MTRLFKYQDFVDQQLAGAVHAVFIDDTGSPGLRNTPHNLHPARKSWVAVVIGRESIAEVWRELPPALDELRQTTGATEFHFTDTYAGKNQFKGVSLPTRLAIFQFMARVFEAHCFPVIVQTLDPDSSADVRSRGGFPSRLGPFDLTNHEDLALFFLLTRAKWHIEHEYAPQERQTRVFVDEGYKRNGTALHIPAFSEVFCDGLVCFARSDIILPLQLADFAAFCLNRSQLLLGRTSLTALDTSFLRIVQSLAWNYKNLPITFIGSPHPEAR